MAHLHGKRLMDLSTPSEEAFIRFVVILDILRYHFESLAPSLDKYDNLFCHKDKDAVYRMIEFVKEHEVLTSNTLSACKPFKGYHTKDILLFMIVKKQVLSDRKNQRTVDANNIDVTSGNPPTTGIIPFTFSFPESIASIKVEPNDSDSNKKRKLTQDGSSSIVSPSMAMEFDDDGETFFDYSTLENIPFYSA
jgi:hypothetical protein